jgi:hypothetical protein
MSLQVLQKAQIPFSIETRRGFPQSVADLRRVRINAASKVFVMQPDAHIIVSPKGQEPGRVVSTEELSALKTATALYVSAMSGSHVGQRMIIQDSGIGGKDAAYMQRFQECVAANM